MELTTLRYFRTIAHFRHMTKAAQALGITQPAMSAAVRRLELEVGVPLFDRTGRGVELTDAGRVFLVHAEEALARAQAGIAAVRELAGLESGSIRVGAGATATAYLLPPVVSAVRRKHPGLRFFIREAGSSAVAAAVISGELDLGIVTAPPKNKWSLPGGGELFTQPLVDDELRLLVPPGHALASKGVNGFRWKDIADDPFVAFEAGTAVRDIIDRAAAADSGVVLNVVMELRSIESIQSMVRAGIGVGLVSRFALPPGHGLPCKDSKLSRALTIVRRRDRVPSPAAAEFERQMTTLWRSKTGRGTKNARDNPGV